MSKKTETQETKVSPVATIAGVDLYDNTPIEYQQDNPKRAGTKIHGEYEKFKGCKTVGELREARPGQWKADVKFDFDHGFLKIDGSLTDKPIGRKGQAAVAKAAKES